MLVKESLINPDKFFNLNGLEYEKDEYVLVYNNLLSDTSGNLIKDGVNVGLKSKFSSGSVLVYPIPFSLYTNGITFFTDLDTLILYLSDLIISNIGSLGGVVIKQKKDTFAELQDGLVAGELSYVETATGTKWNPLSGYKPAGWYVWNGTIWVSDRNAIATQLEANILSLSQKTDKEFMGWVQFFDTQYTELNPFNLVLDVSKKLTNNAGSVLDIVGLFGANDLWDPLTNKFKNDNSGDKFLTRISFIIETLTNDKNLTLELKIEGTQNVVWSRTIRLAKGSGVATVVTENLDYYTLDNFLSNGGSLYLTCSGDAIVYDIDFIIERAFRNN